MVIKSFQLAFLGMLCCSSSLAFTDETTSQTAPAPIEIRYNWDMEEINNVEPFQAVKPSEIEAENIIEDSKKVALIEDTDSNYEPKPKTKQDFADELLDKLPFKNTLRHTWNVIDGDVDIMDVEGLRVDRGNTGLSYTTGSLPFWGEVDGMEIEFCAGEKNEINFESSAIPFIGKVDGFQMKSSVSEDNSRVYVSYSYSFD